MGRTRARADNGWLMNFDGLIEREVTERASKRDNGSINDGNNGLVG